MTKNRTVWRSDNQGVKEHSSRTFIQEGQRWATGMERTRGKAMARGNKQGGGLRSGQSHICMQINQEEQMESKTDRATQGSNVGK